MSAKTLTALIVFSCFVVWGMPANRITHDEAGIALAQDADTDGQRLIRELEEALKSRDQERIRQAQQRVNAHKQAAYLLSQRPALQLQLKTAISQPQAAAVKSQTTLSQTQQKQAAPLQTRTLERSGGLSSAAQLQGASRSESLALPSTQMQGMAKEGMTGRLQGASQEPISTGTRAIQGVSREMGGVSRETAVGVSSAGIQGTASEISRGTGLLERPVGISREGVKALGTASSVGSGTAAPDALASSPPVAAQVKAPPPEPPAPVRRSAPAPKPTPTAGPASPAPVAAAKPAAPATTPSPAPGFVPAPAGLPKAPAPALIDARPSSVETVKSMASTGAPASASGQAIPKASSADLAKARDYLAAQPPKTETPLQMPPASSPRGIPPVLSSNDLPGRVNPNPLDPSAGGRTLPKASPADLTKARDYLAGQPPKTETPLQAPPENSPMSRYPAMSSVDVRGRVNPNPLDPLADEKFLTQKNLDRTIVQNQPNKPVRLMPDQNHPTAGNMDQIAQATAPPGTRVTVLGSSDPEEGPLVYRAGQKTPERLAGTVKHETQHETTRYLAEVNKPGSTVSSSKTEQISAWQEAQHLVRDRGLSPNHPEVQRAIKYYEQAGGGDPAKLQDSLNQYARTTGPSKTPVTGGQSPAGTGGQSPTDTGKFEPVKPQLSSQTVKGTDGSMGPGRRSLTTGTGNEPTQVRQLTPEEAQALNRAEPASGTGTGGRRSLTTGTGNEPTQVRQLTPEEAQALNRTGSTETRTGQRALTEGRSSVQEPGFRDQVSNTTRGAVERVQNADKALGDKIGLGQLPADASSLRAGANVAGGAALGALAAYGSYQAGQGIGDNLREGYLDRQMADQYRAEAQDARQQGNERAASVLERTAEDLDKRGAEKYEAAATDTATFGGTLALGAVAAAVAPTAATLYGGAKFGEYTYNQTRDLLENTETGREIDKGAENIMDRGMQAGEALTDQVGGLLGGQTKDDRDRAQLTGRQSAYDRALERGTFTLRDGVTREDLMDYLKNRNPAPSKNDGYTAADYQAGLNELISKTPRDPSSATPAVPQTGAETAGTGPVKSRQDQDLIDFQQLQGLKNLQAGETKTGQEPPKDAPPPPVVIVDPPKPPVPPDAGENAGNRDFATDYLATQLTDKFGGIQDPQERQNAIAAYLRNLRDAERGTGPGTPPSPTGAGGGGDPNLQLALNSNVTGSVQQNLDQQRGQEAQQTLGTLGGTQAERSAAAQSQQNFDQSRVQAQGQQTSQAISANAQEFTASQQSQQLDQRNSLGNILVGSLMGGLSSGIATGIDNFAGGVGRGAGQQVSVNWGIQPPLPATGTGSTGGQTTGSQSATTGQTGSTSQTSISPTTTSPTTTTTPPVSTPTGSTTSGGSTTVATAPTPAPPAPSCPVAGTCSFTKYADKNGCCSVCKKKVAGK